MPARSPAQAAAPLEGGPAPGRDLPGEAVRGDRGPAQRRRQVRPDVPELPPPEAGDLLAVQQRAAAWGFPPGTEPVLPDRTFLSRIAQLEPQPAGPDLHEGVAGA